jgi:hypothetical protein
MLKLVDNSTWCCKIVKYLFMWIDMLISCSGSARETASSTPWMSLCGGVMAVRRRWKGMTTGVELRWPDALAREKKKQRRGWVMWRVVKVEITFLEQWRVWVGLSGERGQRWWCGFNASVSAREWRWRDEALSKDKAEVASSSWLHGKEAWHGAATWRHRLEERRHQRGEKEIYGHVWASSRRLAVAHTRPWTARLSPTLNLISTKWDALTKPRLKTYLHAKLLGCPTGSFS